MGATEKRLASLSSEKLALLARRLRRAAEATGDAGAIGPRADRDDHPLSYAQQRLWFLDQLEPGNPFYNIPAALRLSGPLDVAALSRSLVAILSRHEVLRARFVERDGRPRQLIAAAPEALAIPLIDLVDTPAMLRAAEAHRLAAEEAQRPFDLARDPLLRAALLRLAADEHILLLTVHHIVADGWSMDVLVGELGALYRAAISGAAAALPELPIQYADYADWQRAQLAAPEQAESLAGRQIAYWRAQLEGCALALDLPSDRPRPPALSYRGAHHRFRLTPELAAGLRALAQRERASLYMLLLAAFEVLLYRYSGQERFCVGAPIANRGRAELEPLVGLFVNTLALPADLSGAPGFRTLLGQVRESLVGGHAHQDLPFEMLVEALQPERDPSRTPIFQVMFNMQSDPLRALRLDDLQVSRVEAETGSAKTDLSLTIDELADGLFGTFEYSTDLFGQATVERMAGHYLTLLEAAVADPDQPVARLPLLGADERRQILHDWNATATTYPSASSLHQLFVAQAARTPDVTALIFEGQPLSYASFDARANQLAHHLQACGVGPDRIVGICVERSLEMLVGIYAILKAGGAYLPLDPAYPAERLAFMVEDAQPVLILTQQHLDAPIPADAPVFYLDRDWSLVADQPTSTPPDSIGPDNLAYVIYTSGSTGRPKGALISHGAILNRLYWHQEYFGLRPHERVLQKTPFSFDVSVWELFWPLCWGGTLVLARPEGHKDSAYLAALIQRETVTTVHFVPPMLQAFLEDPDTPSCTALTRVICSGEALPYSLQQRFYARLPHAVLHNLYGPTEAAVDVSYWTCRRDDPRPVVPIGFPVANTQLYVLDGQLRPVPTGVAGELHIGGVQLARGYLNRPELTEAKFIAWDGAPDLAGPGPQRLYKTGDLARYLPDGAIEYLGRLDHQVKIRGFRIELGEIEAVLTQHEAIREAVVLARADRQGGQQLIAYVVPSDQLPTDLKSLFQELRRFLGTRLPDYMLPVAFVALERFPLNSNGKVDRKALPEPAEDQDRTEYLAPRTPLEEVLAVTWADLLGSDQIGLNDNFFELGGHSLLATRLVSRVRDTLKLELPVRAVFEAPTLAALAERVGLARAGEALTAIAPPQPARRDGPQPASFAQQRLWFLSQMDPASPLYTIAGAVQLSGALDAAALEAALSALVARHESLRTTFATVDGVLYQVIAPAQPIALALIDLRGQAAAGPGAAEQALAELARAPFDLERGPLLRARLLRLADDEHLLAVAMHHTIADGWSLGLIIRELGALYGAITAGAEPDLAPLPLQYTDYAHWQREQLRGESLQQQLGYWRGQLGGSLPLLTLPTDRPRPPEQSFRGARAPFSLPRELADGLRRLSRAEGATLFMTLLAGFQALLSRYSGQDDICVGTPIAGRRWSALEPVVGCFVNTLVLRSDLSAGPSFRELLHQVRQTTLDAYTHQDLPFETLVDDLKLERDLAYSPLFQVMFVLQNTPDAPLALPGLEARQVEVDAGFAAFDLSLEVQEAGDELRGALEYNSDLFDAATAERMLTHLRELLAGAVADPDQPVARLPLLTAAERRQLLVDWNATARPISARCVHELIAEQAGRSPDAIALEAGQETLSYAALNAQANRLAHYLQARGVGPETIVGLCLSRSIKQIVTLLGILRAGGAYLPLDPAVPRARLAAIIADARPALVLSTGDLAASLGEVTGDIPIVDLDREAEIIAAYTATPPPDAARPAHLAYVIYTSGSTGTPKGVMIEHRSLANHNRAVIRQFGLGPDDRVLQFNTISFDAAVEEIFPALICGARLVLRPDGPAPGGTELLGLVATYGVTLLDLPTAYWHALTAELAHANLALPRSLRLVVVGGEAATAEALASWRRLAPHVAWMNTYGPTETTVIATSWLLPASAPNPDEAVVPLGRPVDNLQAYVLDAAGAPVPIGVFGELYIGGAGVARGYLNRPELTDEKFVPDPFSGRAGARLYRSGDRVRWRADGALEFGGRGDDQVKLRGFRVEPGEVAATLAQHSEVGEALVIPRALPSAQIQLVAYVVPHAMPGPDATALRDFLRARLPDYMVPAAFAVLPALPLTPAGKIDRSALPATEPLPEAEHSYVLPEGRTEQTLAEIWAGMLGVARVGRHDNFFALGGDSILTIQVIARARQHGLTLTPRDLFLAPTIADLALRVGMISQIQASQGAVTGTAPLTPIQGWFFEQGFTRPGHWNQSVLLTVSGRLDAELLRASLARLAAHHDALRMRFTRGPDGWCQRGLAPDEADPPPLEVFDLGHCDEGEWQQQLAREAAAAQAGLDLAAGPLLRAVYFDLGADRPGRLLLVIHHLVVDTVSWRFLLEDLQAIYTGLRAGEPAALPAKSTAFLHWAERMAAHAESVAMSAALGALEELLGAPPTQLPVDLDGGPDDSGSERELLVEIDEQATDALLREAPAAYGTETPEVLLAALAAALAGWSGERVQLIALEGHGRTVPFDDVDLSRTIGWFTSLYPVRVDLRGAFDTGAVVRQAKEQLRAARRLSLDYGLLRYLCPDPRLRERARRLPAPQVLLNYLGQLDAGAQAEGLFGLADEPAGPERDPASARGNLLAINGGVSGGRLRLRWSYSLNRHRPATIERLADEFRRQLLSIIEHCQSPVAGGHTPSDFPDVNLSQDDLDAIMAEIGVGDN